MVPLSILQGTYEKGTNDDIEEFIYQLLDVFGDGTVGRQIVSLDMFKDYNSLVPLDFVFDI